MYAHIRGIVVDLSADRVVVEACGIGYEIICSATTLRGLTRGAEATLLTHFHLAQDAVTLFGFLTDQERIMFRKLLSVSRVGPKVAINVLSVLTPSDLCLAVLTDNTAAFKGVSGMGQKTAARIILELKENVRMPDTGTASPNESGLNSMRSDAITALVALGYDGVAAGRAVANVDECDKVETMITLALRELARK